MTALAFRGFSPVRSTRTWWNGAGAAAFNRRCLWLGTIWLMFTIPLGIKLRPTPPDFEQFYMGGQIVRHGMWDALYPIPHADSVMNPGLVGDSDARPAWQMLEARYRVPPITRFILPPPSALLFVPLTVMSYRHAFWAYTALLTLAVVGVGWFAARSLRVLMNEPTRWEGALILLATFSPMTARAIRICNTTPLLALLIAMIVFELMRSETWPRAARAALFVLIGAMLKYATLVLLPVILLQRRWRTLLLTAVFGAAALGMTLAVGGRAPFETFARDIAPRLSRPYFFLGNQSIAGHLVRVHDSDNQLPRSYRIPLAVGRVTVLGVVLGLLLLGRRGAWGRPEVLFAAATALLSWMMLYSPVMWEHYPIFIAPFWGWLLWEARRPGLLRAAVIAALVLINIPQGIFHVPGFFMHDIRLPEFVSCSQTYGMILVLGIAAARLAAVANRPRAGAGEAAPHAAAMAVG